MAIITISRGTFSGGQQLADCLGQTLGYRVLSREVLAEAAVRYGVSEADLAVAMRSRPRLWDRFLHDRRRYLAFVQSALCEEVVNDNVVYHGHAGHLLLRSVRHVLRVRLIAPLEYRIQEVERRQGLSHQDAASYVSRVDRDREKWTRFLYGVNWHDPSLYDLVLNLECLDVGVACGAIATIAMQPRFRADEPSHNALEELRLASRVRATLAADSSTRNAEVEVTAHQGSIEIEGKLPDPKLVETVVAVARAVEGVKEVRYGTRVMLRDAPP
jgi:cytidylate kinase